MNKAQAAGMRDPRAFQRRLFREEFYDKEIFLMGFQRRLDLLGIPRTLFQWGHGCKSQKTGQGNRSLVPFPAWPHDFLKHWANDVSLQFSFAGCLPEIRLNRKGEDECSGTPGLGQKMLHSLEKESRVTRVHSCGVKAYSGPTCEQQRCSSCFSTN